MKECLERGEDYDRVKLLDLGADEAERWERKRKKTNPDQGFAGLSLSWFFCKRLTLHLYNSCTLPVIAIVQNQKR